MHRPSSSSGQTRVLCVDDDTYLSDLLRYALTREGYAVQLATRGSEALKLAELDRPDAVILDVNLPDINGYELCSRLRATNRVPVLLLTARHTDEDVITGFGHGADDYISKPFSMAVLVHRLGAVLRRTAPIELPTKRTNWTYRLCQGIFNAASNHISSNGRTVKLTVTEGKILHLLLTHEGQVFNAERIIEAIWDYDTETNVSVIKTHIRHLRMKLGLAFGSQEVIHTVPGMGYTCRQPLTPLEWSVVQDQQALG